MAVVYDPSHRPLALDDIAPFVASPAIVEMVRRESWEHRHKHLARWRRSVRKRLARLSPPATSS
jgi:hypothetical protein